MSLPWIRDKVWASTIGKNTSKQVFDSARRHGEAERALLKANRPGAALKRTVARREADEASNWIGYEEAAKRVRDA